LSPEIISISNRIQKERRRVGYRNGDTNLWLITLDTLHALKRLVQRIRALLEARENPIVLLAIQFVTRLSFLGRVDHHLYNALAQHGRTQLDRNELVHLGRDFGLEANELKVPATMSAFANHALGHRVQRSEFNVVVLAGLGGLEVAQGFFEGDEFADEDVCLVDFVCEDNEVFLGCELQDGLDVFGGEGRAGGVTWVNDADGFHVGAFGHGFIIGAADGGHGCAPGLLLFEVVGDDAGVEDGEGCGVERVLRDGHHDTGLGLCADGVQQGVDAGGGAVAEVDVLEAGGVAISSCILLAQSRGLGLCDPTLNVLGNALSDAWCALALAVCAHALDFLQQLLRPRNDIRLVAQAIDEHILVLEQSRVLQQTCDLAEECDGLLVQLLRVSNVRCDDGVEGEIFALALCQRRAVLFRLDG
jgi:hypothetical protein